MYHKFQLQLTVLIFSYFLTNLPKKGISGQKRKNRIHGRYLLYLTFPHGGRQTQRYFNVTSPSSRRGNNITIFSQFKKLPKTNYFISVAFCTHLLIIANRGPCFFHSLLDESFPFPLLLFHFSIFRRLNLIFWLHSILFYSFNSFKTEVPII